MAYSNIRGGSYYSQETMSVYHYKIIVLPSICNTAFTSFRLIRRRKLG